MNSTQLQQVRVRLFTVRAPIGSCLQLCKILSAATDTEKDAAITLGKELFCEVYKFDKPLLLQVVHPEALGDLTRKCEEVGITIDVLN